MGFWDFLGFGGGDDDGGGEAAAISPEPLIPSWQMGLGQDISSWVQKFLSMYNPGEKYPGTLSVKTPSSYEQTGLDQLGQLLAGPATGDLFGAAKNQVMDTLGGRYADLENSPFIKAMSTYANQNLRDAINQSRGRAGARGNFFSRSAIQEESNLSERTQNFMNTVVGDFLNSERGRQMQAVPFAGDLDKYENLTAPLARIDAATTTGALPRLLEQADLDRMYQDYVRGRSELSAVPGVGRSLFGQQPDYAYPQSYVPPTEPSGISKILGVLNKGGINFGGNGDLGDWKTWGNLAIKYLPMFL